MLSFFSDHLIDFLLRLEYTRPAQGSTLFWKDKRYFNEMSCSLAKTPGVSRSYESMQIKIRSEKNRKYLLLRGLLKEK